MEKAFSNQNGCLQADSKRSLTPLLLMPWERWPQLKMKTKQLAYCLFFTILTQNLFGQVDLKFDYHLTEFKTSVTSDISIIKPTGDKIQIYVDTIRKYDKNITAFFDQIGQYKLMYRYLTSDKIIDSLNYNFVIIGNEADITISVELKQDIKTVYKRGKWTEIGRKNEGYISVIKHYKSLENVTLIPLNKPQIGMYPIFQIANNSKDTLFGEYLNGYFWGSISQKSESGIWTSEYYGGLDMNFEYLPPLYPDSSTNATVGSFAEYKIPKSGIYRFLLLYSKTGKSHGYRKNLTTNMTNWWTKTEEFYKIEKEFEVK